MACSDSILLSVKKLIGLDETCEEFDADILMNINAAIMTLRQLGVGPKDGYTVYSKEQIYEDYLGVDNKDIPLVRMYLSYKVRLGFDPPQSTTVMECLKEMIKETEWRLNAQNDPKDLLE